VAMGVYSGINNLDVVYMEMLGDAALLAFILLD